MEQKHGFASDDRLVHDWLVSLLEPYHAAAAATWSYMGIGPDWSPKRGPL